MPKLLQVLTMLDDASCRCCCHGSEECKVPSPTLVNLTHQHIAPKQLTMNPIPYIVVAPKLGKSPPPAVVVPALVPPKPNNDRALALAVTLTLAFIIAIGLPVTAVVPLKYIDLLSLNILVPLYLDPDRGAWDRLYEW